MNLLDAIKAAQREETATTGIDPYSLDDARCLIGQAVGELDFYQSAMMVDQIKIKNEVTLEGKARVKALVLPTYLEFVGVYVGQEQNYPNDVAVQVMIWLLDVGNIHDGLELALCLVKQGQKMPVKFNRDIPTFLCDFFYDWAGAELKKEHSASPYLDTLTAVAENDSWAVHPLCMSKLFAMLAKHKEQSGEYQTALALCLKAEAINPEKAGVKGLKERVQAKLQ
ncbi:phage terminase small subunit [Methylobacter sp. S3L5C]|uniref:phage terminase small subunit n=1 Tax=Methylobacter sp. S3L5C TaxID=2839024 RepID=UPI001FAD0257|nr:phage terminase small subunit [Methylobacter sp. S3L5C]UOA08600.1 hypothetical protein KKZ03_20815 [Methylobacter sp. S3L5C]